MAVRALVAGDLATAERSYLELRLLFPDCLFGSISLVGPSPRSVGFQIDDRVEYYTREAPAGKVIIGVGTEQTGRGRETVAVVTAASCTQKGGSDSP